MQDFRLQQQLLAPRTAAVELDRGEDAFFIQAAVQVDFAVAGALELFKNHFIHAAASVDQRSGDDGERTAFFDIARRTKEALGAVQSVGIDTAREHLAAGRHDVVVGAGQAGDGIEQDYHVLFQFDQTLGALDHHFGDVHVARGWFIEGGGDDLAPDRALHFGDLFRTLVYQQHHQVHVGIVGRDRMRNMLHHHRLATLGRRHQQGALAAADRSDQINHAAGDVFLTLDVALKLHLLGGKQRREVFEHYLVLVRIGRAPIDFVELVQRKVAFAVLGCAHFAFHHVAGVQVEAPHLAGTDVNIIGTGGVIAVGVAQKTKAVGQDLQHAVGKYLFAHFGALLDDGAHQLLLAHAASVFDFELFGLLEHFGDVQHFEFIEVHGRRIPQKR